MESANNNDGTLTGAPRPQIFRVFLASPGDVPLERKLARETIAHVNGERRFRGRLDIEVIAWDQPGAAVAMEAGLTPQEAIAQGLPKPEDCDLAVVVLWSRIGTPLPADFDRKDDGTPYLSGTEWEYLNALASFKAKRSPAVWVYRRQTAPQIAIDDPDRQAKIDQWDKLQGFFARFTNPDGTLAGGINHYDGPDDFRRQFEDHLRDRLDKLLETLPKPAQRQAEQPISSAPIWTEVPYPGLAAFTPAQAPIFFGRGAEIDQLLRQLTDPRVRFVAVVGVSGSGKSSLVSAGVLPRLRTGIVGAAPWVDLYLKPGERGGNPFLALAYAIKDAHSISVQTELELARACESDTHLVVGQFRDLLARQADGGEFVLVVDQFEELFTQATADKASRFIALLDRLTAEPRLRVIVTLRADFYARAIEEPVLARLLRRDGGTFPLDPPGMAALHEMIVRPAEAAGVELQEGLAQRLLDEAGGGASASPGAMALIAFTLNQLYEQAPAPKSTLSISAYEAFGGVQGAVQQRAEQALQGLPVDPEIALPRLFAQLVEVDEQEIATRRRARQANIQGDAKTVAQALTGARLLVGGEGEDRQPTLEVAHEIVLNGWTRLRDWIGTHAESLRARRDLERAAGEWKASGRHAGALRGGRLLARYFNAAAPHSETAEDYLRACRRRKTVIRFGYAVLTLLSIAAVGSIYHLKKSEYDLAFAAKAQLVHWGLWPLVEPEMVPISAGRYERSDPDLDGNEQTKHAVDIAAFHIGRYEVTFDEYDLFAAATGRARPDDEWGEDHRGRHPAINVSWQDAQAYATWLSERTRLGYRLPSEAEWEYASRAGTKTEYYWSAGEEGGPDPACTYANVFDKRNAPKLNQIYSIMWEPFECPDEYPFTAPVGRFNPNQWHLYDMLGNVWEWVQDCYEEGYSEAPADGTAHETVGECNYRVMRGGSWNVDPRYVSSFYRVGYQPGVLDMAIGFRLARTP